MCESFPATYQEAVDLGLRWYWSGKPCRKGHVAKRSVSRRWCHACELEAERALRARNPEKYRGYYRKWRSVPENAEKDREKGRARWAQSAEPMKERIARWATANPEKARALRSNRDARRRAGTDRHSAKDRIRIRDAQGDRCAICRTRLKGGGHLDHIIPLARGGSNKAQNLQWLCEPCNKKKGAKDPVEYMQSIGLLL